MRLHSYQFVMCSCIAMFVLMLGVGMCLSLRDYSDVARGSPALAAEWKAAFERFNNPEDAQAAFPEAMTRRFANGEWVFGMSRDSHRYHDGGTIVLKDNTGKVRVFFGHVCGPRALESFTRSESLSSLDDFYQALLTCAFRYKEYSVP